MSGVHPPARAGSRRRLLQPAHVPRGLLGVGERATDEVQAAAQEAGVREMEADDLPALPRRGGPAGAEQVEVGGDEALALLLVARVDRQREQLAVRVRVDVSRR